MNWWTNLRDSGADETLYELIVNFQKGRMLAASGVGVPAADPFTSYLRLAYVSAYD